MDSKTYIANAIRTESVPEKLTVHETAFHALLEMATATALIADQFKRRLYYGKPMDKQKLLANISLVYHMAGYLGAGIEGGVDFDSRISDEVMAKTRADMPEEIRNMNLDNLNIRLLHAALGVFTEAGEALEALRTQYETGALDVVNVGEELAGDVSWYQAIGIDAAGLDLDNERAKNIAKLKLRYPNKFDAEAAVNRDVAAERAVLEGQVA